MADIRELKRELDAKLTQSFISNYTANGKDLAKLCATELGKIQGAYYLKGGNALSILKNTAITGDWDFQFKPEKGVYDNWSANFPAVDASIVEVLKTVAKAFVSKPELETVFKNLIHKDIKPVVGDIFNNNKTCNFTIGKVGYAGKKYNEIISDSKFAKNTTTGDGRLELGQDEKVSEPAFPCVKGKVIPCIYVNYSIPGFILYRLAIMYSYELQKPADYYPVGDKRTAVTLKSELIDISVPRAGSSECYLSQDGVITNFFAKDGIRIPGWGYHFYENINLLQEIKLGISGSAHKKEKRIARGMEAMTAIKNLNKNVDVITTNALLKDSDTGNTKGVVAIMLEMVDAPELKPLKDALVLAMNDRVPTAKLQTFNSLVDFDFKWLGRPLVSEIMGYLKGPLQIIALQGSGVISLADKARIEFEKLKAGDGFKVVSPLLDLNMAAAFPLPFVLIELNAKRFSELKINKNFVDTGKGNVNMLIWRLIPVSQSSGSITPLSVRFVFIKKDVFSNYDITTYLEKTIIESQRMALAEAYQR